MNKKGWLKIVEAFIAIMLVVGVALVLLNQGYFKKDDISSKVYDAQLTILREIQANDNLRQKILDLELNKLPVDWNEFDDKGVGDIKNTIENRVPNYLICVAKICDIDAVCEMSSSDYPEDKDIYAQTVGISATTQTYNPRQLKLFCWIE